ncbi:MAG: M36 family metallopeptidase [Verrucomicrobiota bacterium]
MANFDKRVIPAAQAAAAALPATQAASLVKLGGVVPGLKVDFAPITGSPKVISAAQGFLTGPNGQGQAISPESLTSFAANDPHRVLKAFLMEHRQLFGHGPEALDQARVLRDYTDVHNGLHTVVWEQQVDGIPIFEGVLKSHTTKNGELVNVASQFVAAPAAAADLGTPQRAMVILAPPVTARQAVVSAVSTIGETLVEAQLTVDPANPAVTGAEQRQVFTAPGLKGQTVVQLRWVPMDKNHLQLCWDVIFMSRARGEMFRVLVSVQTGEALVRRCLTAYLTDATYNVFTSDSPSPLSPGYPTPVTNQPPLVSRTLVTLPALDTNASPAGWINDGGNETWGNNVDAHTDRNGDDIPDLPRPQGSPARVFNFPMDLTTQDPTNYSQAAVVQLFYLCNWYHDKMYALGFTEAAGNFQSNNFGRGGFANDAVMADAQDGSGTDNANFSTPPDGNSGRMQMYLFTGMSPRRDGDLDAEVVIHEHTHGLSWRLVGGGDVLGDTQSDGMGEGWSDFYAMSLLSEPADDVNGNYASGGYASYKIGGPNDLQNYYFGIRRYPYTTAMARNPLTFKDIDPAQADFCSSPAPYHTGMFGPCNAAYADEVHNEGEVWCVTLWEARANLINKYGWTIGNQLILQLVTDGMKLSPAHPNFLQARDAIIQADLVNNGGTNRYELWTAFAKRGMGYSATSPSSSTASGVHESFDLPPLFLQISPADGLVSRGPVGGPFSPSTKTYTLLNSQATPMAWRVTSTQAWLSVSQTNGILPANGSTLLTITVNAAANGLPMGIYTNTLIFTNSLEPDIQSRPVILGVGVSDNYTELFDNATTNDLAYTSYTFTPDGRTNYWVCRQPATVFPTDPTGGTLVPLNDNAYAQVTLTGTNTVAIYNRRTNVFFIGSNGYLTMNRGDTNSFESLTNHFSLPRVSACFHDWNPRNGGTISWKQTSKLVAVTFTNVYEAGSTQAVSFQIQMFFDGRIRLTYLNVGITGGLAGLSAGLGMPNLFMKSDFSTYDSCQLGEAVEATNLVWTTGGDAYWFPETSTTFDGVNADQSGKIGDGQQSWIETTVVGPATLSFYCKVSSELGFDKLQFYTNGAPYPNNGAPPYPQFEISGEIDWHQRTFALAPGTNVLRWRYIKDGSGASGTDAAWLDQVQVAVPTPPQITSVLTNQSVIIGSNATFSVTATGTAPLLYQWYYNGAPIGYSNGLSIANTFGAAFGGVAALGIANAQPADAKNYYVVVTNLYGSATSSIATLTVIPLLPLAVAVNNPGLAVATGGDAPWLGLPTITHDGVAAAQSGFIGDAMQSWMEITVVGPSHIGFWWKVSSETNTDYLEFTLNGVRTNLISGEVDWTRVGYDVPAGTNVVRWNYVKNGSVSAGQDAGWVDQILIGRPPVVVQNPPSRLTVPLHGGTNLSVTVSGDLPMQYQWYLDATALAHATNTQLSLAQVQYVQSGPYSLVISNTYGVVTSTPARLLILPPGQIHTNTASVAGTITIPSAGPASVYPFTNLIAGVTGSVQQVTLTVSNLTHPYPADLQMLLVSPTGQAVLFLAGGSNGAPVAGATLTFDDTAATGVPAQSAITSGVYRPTVIGLVPALPAPAPTNGYATNLAAFTGSDPNGVWSLFINAGSTNGAAAGSVAGWSLNFVTQPAVIPPAIFPPAITSGQILFSLRPEVGKTVYIEYKDNLQQTLWQALTNFPGDGNLHTISNLTSGASGRFFRMYLQ